MKALALNVCHVEEDWDQNIHFMTFQR